MSQLGRLEQLLGEVGPAMQLAGVYAATDGETWELVLADGFSLMLEYDENDDRLTITGNITHLDPTPPVDLLLSFLRYNAATVSTGGVRLALDSGSTLLLIYDMPITGLDLDKLKNTILSVADKLNAWRDAIANRRADEDDGGLQSGAQPADVVIFSA